MLQRVFFIMAILMFIGMVISLFISPDITSKSGEDFLRAGLENIPSWYGAIAGIFGSTFLSYFYAIEKQQRDDLKKEHDKNIESASKILITIANCIEQLKSIKDIYMQDIDGNTNIERSFRTINMVHGELTTVSVDTASLCFLVKPRGEDIYKYAASNPVFIHGAFCQYNDILALMKEKKAMGDNLIGKIYEIQRVEYQVTSFIFNPGVFFGTKTFHDIMNFIRLSEGFFTAVQDSIDTLSSIATDLTLEMNVYVKEHGLKHKVLSYQNESQIFIKPPTIDVESEIGALIEHFERRRIDKEGRFNMKKWPIV